MAPLSRVRTPLTEPKDNGCRDADSAEECVGAAFGNFESDPRPLGNPVYEFTP
jgi:hypothetical protein